MYYENQLSGEIKECFCFIIEHNKPHEVLLFRDYQNMSSLFSYRLTCEELKFVNPY